METVNWESKTTTTTTIKEFNTALGSAVITERKPAITEATFVQTICEMGKSTVKFPVVGQVRKLL